VFILVRVVGFFISCVLIDLYQPLIFTLVARVLYRSRFILLRCFVQF